MSCKKGILQSRQKNLISSLRVFVAKCSPNFILNCFLSWRISDCGKVVMHQHLHTLVHGGTWITHAFLAFHTKGRSLYFALFPNQTHITICNFIRYLMETEQWSIFPWRNWHSTSIALQLEQWIPFDTSDKAWCHPLLCPCNIVPCISDRTYENKATSSDCRTSLYKLDIQLCPWLLWLPSILWPTCYRVTATMQYIELNWIELKLTFKDNCVDLVKSDFFNFAQNDYNTRGHNLKLKKFSFSNNCLENTFSNRCISCWNWLPNDVVNYRQPCVATQAADYVLPLFFFFFFIHRSFSETTRPILTKFSGIVYSGVVWIIR